MKLAQAYDLAKATLSDYNVRDWRVSFDEVAPWEYGRVTFLDRTLRLNPERTLVLPEEFVRGRVLHEVAHTRLPRNFQHNAIWSRTLLRMGGDGQRYVDPHPAEVDHSPWVGVCPEGHLYPGWSDPHPDYIDHCVVCYRKGVKTTLDWIPKLA